MSDETDRFFDNNEADSRIQKSDAKKERTKAKPNGHDERAPPFVGTPASVMAGKQKPREFVDAAEIFPNQNVSLVGGDGSVGKSRLMLQFGLACTTGTSWLGIEVAQGPFLYFSAEDDRQEVTNRLNEIAEAEGVDLVEAWQLHIFDVVGEDFVLAVDDRGLLKPTHAFSRLVTTIEDYQPVFIVLDGFADIFAGNENNRSHSKQFVNLLRRIARRGDCHVAMLGHPSLTGMSSGTGTSGSTGWNNAVRTRAYLKKPDNADAAPDVRVFEVMKANYRNPGDQIRWELKLADGHFVRTTPKSAFDRITQADVDRIMLKFENEHWRISNQSDQWGGYAVAECLNWDAGRFIAAKERTPEQDRNRSDIGNYLAAWLRSGSLNVIEGIDSYRRPTKFFSSRKPVA